MAREDEVKLIAYNMWEQEGCPNGRDCEHWFMAEAIWEEQQAKAAKSKRTTPKAPLAGKTGKAAATKKKS